MVGEGLLKTLLSIFLAADVIHKISVAGLFYHMVMPVKNFFT